MSAERDQRLARLRTAIAERDLDGLVVSSPANILYLSGFRGSSGVLLVAADRLLLLSDFRYRIQAARQAAGWEFIEVPRRLFAKTGETAKETGLRRLGFDPSHLTCERREELAAGAGEVELAPAGRLVEELRMVKSPEEIAQIRAAAGLADRALAHIAGLLRPGVSEREVALEGEFLMRRDGAEAAAFDIIIASGPNSALPHAETSERELQPGDLVVVDIGARVGGYCSDMTRTYAVGEASERAQEVYRVVHRAQRQAVAAVRPGAVCRELDSLARSAIEAGGYGEYFGHGLGHGVGLEVHEAPRLGKEEEKQLVAGNTVTVEPGIYLPEMGGVRLEDLLAVTSDGAETLTESPMPAELPVV